MSIAGITTLGFGTYASVNQAVVLGFLVGIVPPPPAPAASVPGPADKRKRDREEYFRRRHLRKKQARELKATEPKLRAELIHVIEPSAEVIADPAVKQLFSMLAAPKLAIPTGMPLPPLPAVPPIPNDDDDMFMLME